MTRVIWRVHKQDFNLIEDLVRSALAAGSRDVYPQKVLEKLAGLYSPRLLAQRPGHMIVAEEDSLILGYARFETDHDSLYLASLYVDPAVSGSGVGSTLLAGVEGFAKQKLGVPAPRVYASALLNAAPFYRAKGYTTSRAFVSDVDGVPVPLIPVEKTLLS